MTLRNRVPFAVVSSVAALLVLDIGDFGDQFIEPFHLGVFVEEDAGHRGGMGQAHRVLQQSGVVFFRPLSGQGTFGQFPQLCYPFGRRDLTGLGWSSQPLRTAAHLRRALTSGWPPLSTWRPIILPALLFASAGSACSQSR